MTAALQSEREPAAFTVAVAEELRAQMARKRVTGRELARRLHVSAQWISQRTRAAVPLNTSEIELIADALGISVGDLLNGAMAVLTTGPTTSRYSAASSAGPARLSLVPDLPTDYGSVAPDYRTNYPDEAAMIDGRVS